MKDIIRDFSGGVVQSMPSDKLPPNFLYRAYDTAFRSLPGGSTVVTRRPGWTQKFDITGANAKSVMGMVQFPHLSALNVPTRYLVSVAGGKVYMGTTNIAFTHSSAAFEEDQYWTFSAAGNVLYGIGIAADGAADRFKLYHNGSAFVCQDIGMTAPAAPATAFGAGVMTGDYDIACTWYNSNIGTESSRGTTVSVSPSTQKVTVSRPISEPADATHWRIYIRKQTLGVDYWQVVSNTIATATYDVNLTDTQINNLTILAPDTQENNPPPSNLRDLCWHQSRMFYTDGVQVYYSQPGLPECVDAEAIELINKNDGQKIIALQSIGENTLAVFKERSIYALVGDSPQSWELRTLVIGTGAISKQMAQGDGLMAFWSHNGPTLWDMIGEPIDASNDIHRAILERTRVAFSFNDQFTVVFDRGEKRFLFHGPVYAGDGPITEVVWFTVWPWSAIHRVWESSGWEMPADLSSLAVGFDSGPGTYDADNWVVYLGCGDGRVKLCSAAYRADETTGDTSTSGLVYEVTSNDGNDDLFFTVTDTLKRSTTATYPKAAVIDAETLKVWRLGPEGFTVVNTSGSTYRLRSSSVVWGTDVPPAGSIIVFDAPVVEVWTHKSMNDYAKWNHKLMFADVAASKDIQYFVGFYRDQECAPCRVWQADETSDICENYPEITGRSQPEGYPVGVTEAADGTATGTDKFFLKRIERNGFQAQSKWVSYWPGCRWYLKAIGVEKVVRRDGWQ